MTERELKMTWYHYLIVLAIMLFVVAVVYVLIKKHNTTNHSDEKDIVDMKSEKTYPLSLSDTTDLMIAFDSIEALAPADESALVEIKDKKLLGRLDNAVPELMKTIGQASAVKNYHNAVKNGGQLYQAIIPTGAKLVQSQEMDGAVRGFFRGAKGIQGHANLKPINQKALDKLATSNITSAAMNAASMVVGQYYMSQINHQLDKISDSLDDIASFQENEFKSKIYALIAEVQKCSEFQIEIMESEEQRKRELDKLTSLEHECAQLLGQANLTLKDFEGKANDYATYEKKVSKANTWFMYQQLLLKILMEIDELTYVFSLGMASEEKCYALLTAYNKQSEEALLSLEEWHQKNITAFELDLDESRRKKQGFDQVLTWIPSLFDSSVQYKKLPSNIVKTIKQHRSKASLTVHRAENDLFHQNVRLIIKDGKMFYLPDTRGASQT